MGTNLTIFQKGLILLAIPLLFQLVFFGVLLKMEWEGEEVEHWAVHTKEVIAQAETAYRYLVEANSYVRRLVIAGSDPVPESPFHDALRKSGEELQTLRKLVQDNPSQQGRVDETAARANELRAWLTETSDLVAAGRREDAAARVKGPLGQELLDAVRKSLDSFLDEEKTLDGRRLQELHTSWTRQSWVIGAGLALSVALGLVVALLFAGNIGGRIARLMENVRRLGDKKELTPPLSGSDEIAQVDRVFRDMARALREREQENEMFIYSVSHDLRSPLVNLQGFSEELSLSCQDLRSAFDSTDAAGTSPRTLEIVGKDIPDSVHFIKTAVSRLSAIIDALLRLSRVGRVEYRIQPVNLEETVHRVLEALGGTIEARRASVAAEPLPPALGDPTAVEQIFANLIGNAVNYLDPSRPGRVEIGALPPGQGAAPAGMQTYYVKDNGLGIPEAYQARVFLAFQRLHANVAQGEGVGLALVYRMVGRLGGKIWLESAAGVGSTFFVALPAAPPAGQPAPAAPTTLLAPALEERKPVP